MLGNALEGVPEESEEEEPQPNNSNIESASNLDGQSQCKIEIVFVLGVKNVFVLFWFAKFASIF